MQEQFIFIYGADADLVDVVNTESNIDMSYLKISPLLISVQKSGLDSYVGVLRYDFERYGHML